MQDVTPYLIDGIEASGRKLKPLRVNNDLFSEDWLQKLLHKHPDILPVDLINEAFSPIASIGREIAKIDNLFVSPNGLITIVETKRLSQFPLKLGGLDNFSSILRCALICHNAFLQ